MGEMQPKIIFLGTGGDSTVVGKQRRASGGIVIKVDGYQFLLDPGPGSLVKAKEFGVNLRETTAVLATHGHINHANDINAVISAMTYNGFDRQGVIIGSESVINGVEGITSAISEYFKKCVERVILIKSGQKVGIESMEIHALKTKHSDSSALGFKFYTPSFHLVYSGDTGYTSEIVKQYEKVDILILNVVYPGDVKSKHNLTAEDAEKIIKKVRPKLCLMTHFGNKFLQSDPLYQAREIQKRTGIQVIAAIDGLEINPVSYSTRMNQKTLNLYEKNN